jgi:hypothetical protein
MVEDGDVILVCVGGSHFVWKMVQRIVGVLVEVGRGVLPIAKVAEFLGTYSPIPARLPPSSGLFLERTCYGARRPPPLVSLWVSGPGHRTASAANRPSNRCKCSASAGLVTCSSNPASDVRRRSSVCPHPVNATIRMPASSE